MDTLYPSAVYEPPYDGLPFVGVVVVAPSDVRMKACDLREDAASFVEGTIAGLIAPGGKPRV